MVEGQADPVHRVVPRVVRAVGVVQFVELAIVVGIQDSELRAARLGVVRLIRERVAAP